MTPTIIGFLGPIRSTRVPAKKPKITPTAALLIMLPDVTPARVQPSSFTKKS
jgi:hypothetical protein